MKGILVVSHCILNPYTAVSGAAPNRIAMQGLIGWAVVRDVALVQMPCPEFVHAGASRVPRTLEGYDVPEFHEHCLVLVAGLLKSLTEHLRAGHPLLGMVGIEGSPSCGVKLTTRRAADREAKVTGEGVFIRTLRTALAERGLDLRYLGLPHRTERHRLGQAWIAELDGLLRPPKGETAQ